MREKFNPKNIFRTEFKRLKTDILKNRVTDQHMCASMSFFLTEDIGDGRKL